MITLPIWVFVLMCLCVALDIIEIVIFFWAVIATSIENRKATEDAVKDQKLKESIRIAEIMNPDINPEYIPKEFRKNTGANDDEPIC